MRSACIADEIDALARIRSAGAAGGGSAERENTLNQLLVEMDGFGATDNVVVFAATNRVDVLDKAVLRPGRFDRHVHVEAPDVRGRIAIFRVHLAPVRVAGDLEGYAQRLATLTPGFVGADISNICNEAAIFAARRGSASVSILDFEDAISRVIGGAVRLGGALLTPADKRVIATHEAGHAIVGWFLEHTDPTLKVSIVARTKGSLGFTQYLPRESALQSRDAITDRLCMLLGGRAAEELIFGRVTTGAADDLERATQMGEWCMHVITLRIRGVSFVALVRVSGPALLYPCPMSFAAYAMVTSWGMGTQAGLMVFPRQDAGVQRPCSDSTAQIIDEDVR